MMVFEKACQKAKEKMTEKGYVDGFVEIRENESMWFFSGRFQKHGPTPYGNMPFAVHKENGLCEAFAMTVPGNFKIYSEAKPIDIPKEYKI